jgi:hypothetical protein
METMKAKIRQARTWCAIALLAVVPATLVGQTAAPASNSQEVEALKKQLADQQKQIELLKLSLEDQKKLLERIANSVPGGSDAAAGTPEATAPSGSASGSTGFTLPSKSLGQVASATPIIPPSAAPPAAVPPPPSSSSAVQPGGVAAPDESPLQLHIGTASLTPVGFMDFTTVWSNHDRGSGIGTNFSGIPYGNVFQNNLSEFRESMQNSRIGFRVDANVMGSQVMGYMEADFLGNNPGNVAVTSNSNTMRSRLYWVDVRKGGWEVLGGQTWSLLTPGRTGISPLPGNVFYSQDMDVNYQAGLVWGRIPELRLVYHAPGDKMALAFAVSSPEQYVGGSAGAPVITFPSALGSVYGNELNTGGNTFGVPNVAPDFIAKFAWDPSSRFHGEVAGLLRSFKLWNPATGASYTAEGGGGSVNLNFAVAGGFRLLTNNFWSDGGGRYIFGMVPDLIVRADGSASLIHTGSTVSGFEWTKGNSMFYGYYGGTYIGRNTAIDTNGHLIGYGYFGSPSSQNRAIQEATIGWIQTFWRNPRYGQLSLITQYSYLTRNPWYIPNNGSPENAHLNMIFLDLRYTLPGSAPTLGRP